MHIGIINSVLYIRLFAKGQEQVHTTLFFVFFHTRPQALAQFDAEIMFYTLMERGMRKKI